MSEWLSFLDAKQILFFLGGCGVFLGAFFTILAIKFFPRFSLLDFPERYGLMREKIPYPGGLALLPLFALVVIIDVKFLALFPAIFLLAAVSFWDDKRPISPWFRLGVQCAGAAWLFFQGIKIDFIGIPWEGTNFALAESFPLLAFFITVIWIVAITNAMNWFDGLPGLTPGVASIGFLALGILGLIKPELWLDPQHTTLTQANWYLAGIFFGAFFFYLQKKIILGDTGSQVTGMLLATLAIFLGAKIATTLLVLSLPLLDLFFVVLRRVFLEKKSPAAHDKKHFHHNLSLLLGEKKSSTLLIFFSLIFGVLAVVSGGLWKTIVLVIIGVFILVIMAVVYRKIFSR